MEMVKEWLKMTEEKLANKGKVQNKEIEEKVLDAPLAIYKLK